MSKSNTHEVWLVGIAIVAILVLVSWTRPVREPMSSRGHRPPVLNPHNIPNYISQTLGLETRQVSTILSMIGGPEQSNVEWFKQNNGKSVFGYCENIDDDRGVTMGISGFVSKYTEFDTVFKNYNVNDYRKETGNPDDCKPFSKCKLCDWVNARGNDPNWIAAQWMVYHEKYIVPVMKFMPKQPNLNNALIKGLLLDTAMNAGLGDEGNAWGMDTLVRNTKGSTPFEWVKNFCILRYTHFTKGNTEEGKRGRLLAWYGLALFKKWDMRGVNPCYMAYCNNGKHLGGCKGCPSS